VQSLPVVEKTTVSPAPVSRAPVEDLVIEETAAVGIVTVEPVIEEPVLAPAKAVETPIEKITSSDPPKIGFTLQFENDDTLTRLVSRQDVGLYVLAGDKSLRLGVEGKRLNFWPASMPAQYHEMDGSTVPVDVRRALLRSGPDHSAEPTWGVTLPPRTAAQLQQYLTNSSGGVLIIGGNGDLRLEP
jgi:hypothetical protein